MTLVTENYLPVHNQLHECNSNRNLFKRMRSAFIMHKWLDDDVEVEQVV